MQLRPLLICPPDLNTPHALVHHPGHINENVGYVLVLGKISICYRDPGWLVRLADSVWSLGTSQCGNSMKYRRRHRVRWLGMGPQNNIELGQFHSVARLGWGYKMKRGCERNLMSVSF